MSSDVIEGQMALFESPANSKEKSAKKKAKPLEVKAEHRSVKKATESSAPLKKATTRKSEQKSQSKNKAKTQARPTSGQVPEGDVRLTANIREDLHLKLKIAAANKRTTIGELIEMLVAKHLK
ncbi:hypothetical protein [Geobacter sp.]|uniref:hypothetical protein n=1 Tax=Geobacter sp. TaxID=46610 RepID=UPI0027B91612|nr:hypothetical protein [Geobacter sp.]